MNKRRLLKLARLLEADAKKKNGIKFDLGDWGFVKHKTKPLSCGTTACAMGLAALSGAFKKEGLRYEVSNHFVHISFDSGGHTEYGGFYSASALFEISNRAAEWLFDIGDYDLESLEGAVAERAVARRIRDFIAGKASP